MPVYQAARAAHKKSLISYIGGKSALVNRITPALEYLTREYALSHYIEATGGGARMLLNLDSALFSSRMYNEVSPGLCTLFESLKTRESAFQVMELLLDWGISEERYLWARDQYHAWLEQPLIYDDPAFNRIEAAAITYITAMQSRAATMRSFNRQMLVSNMQKNYFSRVHTLHNFVTTLAEVEVQCESVFTLLQGTRHMSDHLLYIDPPYVEEVSYSSKHYGSNSFSADDHRKLVSAVLESQAVVVLSGYDNDIYTRLESNGFKKIFLQRQAVPSSASKNRYSEEFIFINAALPQSFIDIIADENYRMV